MVVAKSIVSSAALWLEKTRFEFPLLVDMNLALYGTLGLGRSMVTVWNISTLIRHTEKQMSGTEFVPPFEGDDFHQVGGDFLVDSSGVLAMFHPLKTSYDRPSVDSVLDVLRERLTM